MRIVPCGEGPACRQVKGAADEEGTEADANHLGSSCRLECRRIDWHAARSSRCGRSCRPPGVTSARADIPDVERTGRVDRGGADQLRAVQAVDYRVVEASTLSDLPIIRTDPGTEFEWSNEGLDRLVQQGRVRAEEYGLVTVEQLQVTKRGNRLCIWKSESGASGSHPTGASDTSSRR
jgi:hypothetical protein